jgi:hypothetical protein
MLHIHCYIYIHSQYTLHAIVLEINVKHNEIKQYASNRMKNKIIRNFQLLLNACNILRVNN